MQQRNDSVSTDCTANDLRDGSKGENWTMLKLTLGLSWLTNLVLCLLVVFVIVSALVAPIQPNTTVLSAFSIFVLMFVALTACLGMYARTESYVCCAMANVFALQEFLCVMLTSFALFANERSIPDVAYGQDPLLWVQKNSWLPVSFSLVFLPIFLVQLVLFTKYAHDWQHETSPMEKAEQEKVAPYAGFHYGYFYSVRD